MKYWFTVLLFAFVVTAGASGGEGEYAVSNIPSLLLKNANVIKRAEIIRFEITESNRAKSYRKVAFTVLNEHGDPWANFAEHYDKLRSIESFEGSLFDAMGKKIKTLKKSDIKDVSGSDDASLADDTRYRWHSFFYKVYPYTIEYEVEVFYKGTMFLPKWIPQQKPVMSVQQSQLIVISPVTNPVRYKMFNYTGTPVISLDKSNQVYNWEVKNIAAVEAEFAAPAWPQITTSVFMATEKFMLEDYEGSNASWKDFGKFVYDLKKNKDQLPDDIKQKVHQLTDKLTDTREKINTLYEFMQDNTRYISIQMGIGGWQPFDAKFVGSKRYGDCKALSNYMYALLKEAGIRSVYTLTNRGYDTDYLLEDLPSMQFNHAVLFVPGAKDTVWLECTSQSLAAGYVGADNCNRYAVAVDENGGTMIRTPRYNLNENLQIRHTEATIDEEGHLQALIKTKYRAVQQDRLHEMINGLSKDKLMEFLKEDIELPSYDVKSYNYKEEKGNHPVVSETLDLVADHYATVSGKRFFVVPNLITRTHRKLKSGETRKYDIVLGLEFKDIDTTTITIPAGYTPEALPQDALIDSKFGKFRASVKITDNIVTYYRSYEHYSGRFPPLDYPELVKFYDAIYKADRARIVFVKNQTP